MSESHLVLQGAGVAAADLEAIRILSRGRSIVRGRGESMRIVGADPSTQDVVARRCEDAALDWGFVAAGRRLSDFALLAMDMDSTLITVECIDEIADFAGRKAEVAAVTASAMRGEIDWALSLRQRVAALAGLDAGVLERVYLERVRLSPGGPALVAAARAAGLRTLLVSGGFTYFTDRLRESLSLDEAYANELEIEGGKLAGRVTGPLVDARAKARHVARLRDGLGLATEQVLVIGDGANDLEMMAEAGTSVAFRAKPVVRGKASFSLCRVGLEGVLALFPP
jgi:phosphoserine phosphatase